MIVDWIQRGKPSAVGLSVGAVCGLAAVTPASGYASPQASILIGAVAGIICNFVSNWRQSRTKIDDSLDVFACHGIGGIWGSLATGIFASTFVNAKTINGGLTLFGSQLIGVSAVVAYCMGASYLLLKFVQWLAPLRVSPEEERQGLDLIELGEQMGE